MARLVIETPRIVEARFEENEHGGWYVSGYGADGNLLDQRYFLFLPRWWFRFVSRQMLTRGRITDGTRARFEEES